MGKKRSLERIKRDKQELVELTGAENESIGRKAVIELDKIEKGEEQAKKETELNWLDVQQKRIGYERYIAGLLYDRLGKISFPQGISWAVRYSERGVVVFIQAGTGRRFHKAFKCLRNPVLDLNAVNVIASQVENTIDKIEGSLAEQRTSSGVWLSR